MFRELPSYNPLHGLLYKQFATVDNVYAGWNSKHVIVLHECRSYNTTGTIVQYYTLWNINRNRYSTIGNCCLNLRVIDHAYNANSSVGVLHTAFLVYTHPVEAGLIDMVYIGIRSP